MATEKTRKFKMLFSLTDKASAPLKKLRKNFKLFVKATDDVANKSAKFGALAFAPMAGAFTAVSASVVSSVNAFTEYASAAADVAKQVGGSAEKIQLFGYAAKMSGSSAEELNSSLAIFSKNLASASQGKNKELVSMFKQLGISMKDSHGKMKTTTQLLPEIANAMRSQSTAAQKAYIANTLFGKSGQNLIQMLEGGSEGLKEMSAEARELGVIVSDDGIKSAKDFGDHLDKLKFSVKGLQYSIGEKLIPVIEPLVIGVKDWIVANREWIATSITDAVKDFAETLKQIDFKSLVQQGMSFVKTCVVLFNKIGGLKTIAAGVAVLFAGNLLTSFVGMVSAIGTMCKAFWALNAVLWANPIILIVGAIIAAIAAIIYIGYELYKHWDELWAFCGKVWEGIKNKISGAWDFICKCFAKDWEWIKNGICSLPDMVVTAFKKLPEMFAIVWKAIKEAFFAPFEKAFDFVSDSFNKVKGWGAKVGDSISSVFSSNDTAPIQPMKPISPSAMAITNGNMQGSIDINLRTDENTKAEVVQQNTSDNVDMNVANRGLLRG